MGQKRMGFEGLVYYGTAGSTAATLLDKRTDLNYNISFEEGDTTTAGDGSAPPIGYSRVSARMASIDFTMVNDPDDTALEAIRTAAANGTPIALRTKDHSAGKGFDGDVIVSDKGHGKPMKGEQTIKFTAKPNNDARAAQLYV